MTQRQARCACGQLKLTCRGEPRSVSLCHCLECQRRTGSTFGIAAFFGRDQIEVTGRGQLYSRIADNGHAVHHHFCPDCGSTVFWEPARKPDLIAVAVGAFADPSFPAPGQSVFRQHQHGWVTTPG